ncbi:MAG: KH domain-containing protein [bacterium]|nr:KH domain-containing protein [bacterium]
MELVELTEFIVKKLLPCDIDIKVNQIDANENIIIQVLVPNSYMSVVIGKSGVIANSIRTIVQAAAYNKKLGKIRINIDSL